MTADPFPLRLPDFTPEGDARIEEDDRAPLGWLLGPPAPANQLRQTGKPSPSSGHSSSSPQGSDSPCSDRRCLSQNQSCLSVLPDAPAAPARPSSLLRLTRVLPDVQRTWRKHQNPPCPIPADTRQQTLLIFPLNLLCLAPGCNSHSGHGSSQTSGQLSQTLISLPPSVQTRSHLPSLLLQVPDLLGDHSQFIAGVCSDEVVRLWRRTRFGQDGEVGSCLTRVRWSSRGRALAGASLGPRGVQELPHAWLGGGCGTPGRG